MSLCECGCGLTTKIAPRNDKKKGWTKGESLRFAGRGHNASVTNHPWKTVHHLCFQPSRAA